MMYVCIYTMKLTHVVMQTTLFLLNKVFASKQVQYELQEVRRLLRYIV
jgi:hypothetical protein